MKRNVNCSFIIALFTACLLSSFAPGVTQAQEKTGVGNAEWETKWKNILEEARKEGIVYAYGPPLAEVRQILMDEFPKAYPGIKLDYSGLSGGQMTTRIRSEHGAGIYNVDLCIAGTTTILIGAMPFTQPIKPFLILPEVTDPMAWLDGSLAFADDAKEINLVFIRITQSGVIYNTNLVNPDEITSWWDLVKPKWKGKMILNDPRFPGPGNAFATFWHEHAKLGPNYLKALIANEPVFTRDIRIHAESVARGKYSIGIAPHVIAVQIMKAGAPIKYTKAMKEGSYSTAASGSVAVMNRAPNPNAATVFLNWLLGKEGQSAFAKAGNYVSRRLDVGAAFAPEPFIAEPGVEYWNSWTEKEVRKKKIVDNYIRQIFGGSQKKKKD